MSFASSMCSMIENTTPVAFSDVYGILASCGVFLLFVGDHLLPCTPVSNEQVVPLSLVRSICTLFLLGLQYPRYICIPVLSDE